MLLFAEVLCVSVSCVSSFHGPIKAITRCFTPNLGVSVSYVRSFRGPIQLYFSQNLGVSVSPAPSLYTLATSWMGRRLHRRDWGYPPDLKKRMDK